jgi:hypothetical protein
MPELVSLVAEYLAHPERDREARLECAARECGPLDGRSGERVGEQLLGLLGLRAGSPDAVPSRAPAAVAGVDPR